MPMTAAQVENFRNDYREKYISSSYSGWRHFSLTVITTLLVIIGCLITLNDVQALEWLTIPTTFLYANLTEYLGHKGPMHHKTRFLQLLFQRHTVEHHAFFTEAITTFDNSKDFKAVLFPPIMLLFFFGGFALPVGLLFYFLLSPNVAYLFVFTSAAYFLNYELLHFCYHINESSWGSKLPFMDTLRRHHTFHHDRKLMSKYNFNITYPICDCLFGTFYRRVK
jgi:hypothetical protein